jgi:hypothetical protein
LAPDAESNSAEFSVVEARLSCLSERDTVKALALFTDALL